MTGSRIDGEETRDSRERGSRAGLKEDGCEHGGVEITFTVGAEESDTQYLSRSYGSHRRGCCGLSVVGCCSLLPEAELQLPHVVLLVKGQ